MVTATVYCAPALLRYAALAVYCLGSLLGLYKVIRSSLYTRRVHLFHQYGKSYIGMTLGCKGAQHLPNSGRLLAEMKMKNRIT